MANREHLEVISRGNAAIDRWTDDRICDHLEFAHSDRHDADLTGGDRHGVDLQRADFRHVALTVLTRQARG